LGIAFAFGFFHGFLNDRKEGLWAKKTATQKPYTPLTSTTSTSKGK